MITKVELFAIFKDEDENEISRASIETPIDDETILSFDVEHDGQNGTVNPPIPRPKRPRI